MNALEEARYHAHNRHLRWDTHEQQHHQPLVDALEEVGWYVTLTILKIDTRGGMNTHNITNLF